MGRWNDDDRTPLALLRAKRGLTRNEASIIMGIGMITLARYETGASDLPFGIGEQMAKLYNVSFEEVRQAVLATKKEFGISTEGRPKKVNEIRKPKITIADFIKEGALP